MTTLKITANQSQMSKRRESRFCEESVNPYPFYSPRFWAGMRLTDYVGLLAKSGFRIHPARIPMALLVGGCTVASSGLSATQGIFMNRRIENTELTAPPIFVIGHWRSGTTLLHELLCRDEQFAWPSTFECFVPTFHNLTKPFLRPLIRLLLPGTRPMDAMPAGPDLPQEDEFALVGMGAPTPYYRIAFFNEAPRFTEMLNLNRASAAEIQQLQDALIWFYKSITCQKPKQLVLKSPTHTGRLGHLARWFPNAKFVHITRHPHKVFPSTMHLWKSLASVQSYQLPRRDDRALIQQVNHWYQEMYTGYFEQVQDIPAENIVQIRFEDLVKNPVSEIESIYSRLDLQGFDRARPQLEAFWSQRKSHRSNKTALTADMREMINDVWSEYFKAFGYQTDTVSAVGKAG